jgi:uncharacterized protein YggE
MKLLTIVGLIAAIGGSSLLLTACGGGDDDEAEAGIRTDRGLAVAAIGAGFDPRLQATGDASDEAGDGASGARAPGFSDTRYSPYYAPALQQGNTGITVQGYGTASADADSAIVEFYFYANGGGIEPQPAPDTGTSSSGAGAEEPAAGDADVAAQEVAPITEANLQPVIDALVGAGIPRDDIEFVGQAYYDRFSSSATLRVTVSNLAILDSAVSAATAAAAGLGSIQLSSTNVAYAVSDCTALEKAAMDAAADDAAERGAAFAETLGVGIGAITGASHYSYSPYGGYACGSGYGGPYPLAVDSTAASSGSRTVQVFANISVTYAIQ